MSVNTKDNTPVGIVLNGTDKDEQDALNFTLETKPLYGEISSFSPRGSVQYRPFLLGEVSGKGNNQTLSDVGSDAFTFTVSDNRGAVSAPAKVTIISIPNEPTPTPTPEPTPTPTDGLRGILRGLDGDVIPLSPDDSSEPGGIQLPPESLVERFVSPDSFIVETDKDSYEFGDNVTVSGIVRKPITGNVTITVNDPDGKPFVSKGFGMLDQVHWGEDVIPNEQGQFSYRFRLVDANQEDGIQGTYRVQAEYGDETKEVEFTVE